MYGMGNEFMSMGWGWLGMLLMWIIPVILFIVILRFFTGRPTDPVQKSAREILDARYASGAIEREDYLVRLADLKN